MSKSATSAAAPGAAEGAEPAPPKKKGGVVRHAVIGLVLLAGLGGGGWFFLAPRFLGSASAKPAARPEVPVKVTVPLGAVVVNIGRPETRRYLKVGVELGVPGQKDAKEVEEHKPQITDLLITVLTTAPVDTLASEEGKNEIKKALLTSIHEELKLERVRKVYFTEFVIQ
jgi:flagellar FliL protein